VHENTNPNWWFINTLFIELTIIFFANLALPFAPFAVKNNRNERKEYAK
jgi:hypothetical protein